MDESCGFFPPTFSSKHEVRTAQGLLMLLLFKYFFIFVRGWLLVFSGGPKKQNNKHHSFQNAVMRFRSATAWVLLAHPPIMESGLFALLFQTALLTEAR